MQNTFTAVFWEGDDGGVVGYVEEIPGANTEAGTIEEAESNLREAVRLICDANRQVLRGRLPNKRLTRKSLSVEMDV
jgi:predicted RNase H-like HicB family nuclease